MHQPQTSAAAALERASFDLDGIIQELRRGTRKVRHFDELEGRAQGATREIARAFRD